MDRKAHNNEYWMKLALREARKGWGMTNPNPMVGAVIVADGQLVGIGHHEFAGGPHAEINALRSAGKKARGAEIYVTMEPCCSYGRTPPCTEALKAAGIKRVVIGSIDDNPRHAGAGIKILEEAGIKVEVGVMEDQCRQLNQAFFWWIGQRRPYVILKMAQSLDGRIALADGQSKWISGPRSRNYVQKLRKLSDMIMVGGETARLDDPSLLVTARNWRKQPDVCIWTSRNVEDNLRCMHNAERQVFSAKPETRKDWLEFLSVHGEVGCEVLLLEGGGELAASALKAGIVNKLVWFVAPKIIGGHLSRPVVGGDDIQSLSDAIPVQDWKVNKIGEDLMIESILI